MPSMIEFSNDRIRIIQLAKNKKKFNVVRSKEYLGNPLDEGKRDEMVKIIKQDQWNLGKTTLILNSNSVVYREMKLPKLEKKKLQGVIKNEIQAASAINEVLVTDYIELEESEDDKRRYLTCSVNVPTIESCLAFTKEFKGKVKKIEVGYSALLNYVSKCSLKNEKEPYLLVEVGQRNARMFLFDGGEYILVRSVRLPYLESFDRCIELLSAEISRTNQFQLARHFQADIKKVYLFGEYEQLENMETQLKDRIEAEVDFIPQLDLVEAKDGFKGLAYIYSLGTL